MKTMLLAAATALSLGIGSAYAAQGPADGYVYPDYIVPGSVYAGAPTAVQTTPPRRRRMIARSTPTSPIRRARASGFSRPTRRAAVATNATIG